MRSISETRKMLRYFRKTALIRKSSRANLFCATTCVATMLPLLCRLPLTVTQTVTSGPQDRFLYGVIDVGVIVHRNTDARMPHELLKDLGGHFRGIAAAEPLAQG